MSAPARRISAKRDNPLERRWRSRSTATGLLLMVEAAGEPARVRANLERLAAALLPTGGVPADRR